MTRSISLALLLAFCLQSNAFAQSYRSSNDFIPQQYSIKQTIKQNQQASGSENEFPDPKVSLHRSLMVPGWGQITNDQIWKVPIIYGLMGGLTYYSITLHKQYHDYRAAYYNLHPDSPGDMKFGPTPDFINENSSLQLLRENRNFYRNRRDLIYVMIGLSYALNAIDAYVFAHLRSFDVSDDLSLKADIRPALLATSQSEAIPSLSISINF